MRWARLSLCTVLVSAFLAPSLAEAGPRFSKHASYKVTVVQRLYNRRPAGMHSRTGKILTKRLLKAGHIKAAKLTLKKMSIRPNRPGLKGQLDRYRKWSVNRAIKKTVRQKEIKAFLNKKHEPIPLILYPY